MSTATNAVVENQMSPMQSAPATQQLNLTGQYLYDQFIGGVVSEEQKTRMNIVRMLAKTVTFDDIKRAFKDAIEIAHKVDVKNGIDEKVRGPKRQQAMNVRGIMQNAYGALKLAPEELAKLGYTENTGYQDMRVLAAQALKAKGLKWNGAPLPTDETRKMAEIQREKQEKRDAMAEAMDQNPQGDDEDDGVYVLRVSKARDLILAANKTEAQKRVVSKIVADIVQKQGRDMAQAIADGIKLFLESTSEMTEEQVDAVLRKAGEAEALAEAEASEQQEDEATEA